MEEIIFTQLSTEQLSVLIENAVSKAVSNQPPTEKQLPELFTRKQLAEMLGVSLPFIHKQMNEGHLKATKFGRLTRFKREDVTAFLNTNPQFNWK